MDQSGTTQDAKTYRGVTIARSSFSMMIAGHMQTIVRCRFSIDGGPQQEADSFEQAEAMIDAARGQ